MFQNNNRAVAGRIARRSLRADRFRNMIAIFAIAMTTLLFTSVFTMGSGLMESVQRAAMVMSGGDGHAAIKYATDEEYRKISRNPLVKEMAYCRILSDSVDNEKLVKRHTEFWYYDNTGLKFGFAEPTEGHKPNSEKEVIADTKTLELLGVPLKVGAPVTLDLTIHGKKTVRTFILAGWWQSDPGFNTGQIFASRAYVDAHITELENTYDTDSSLTGTITGYIKFVNSINIEGNLKKLFAESGYSMDEKSVNYIATGINWAYLSTGTKIDPVTAAGLGSAAILFAFAGYLIIYNIFQISVLKDIRFYGLLKTIGATRSQLRCMINTQAAILSIIGIPLGLLAGFFTGKAFVPVLLARSSYAGSLSSVSPHPYIFAGAALFAAFTVFISTRKPGDFVSRVSPIEAAGYLEESGSQERKSKRTGKGNRLVQMAFSNLSRNKRRTVLLVLSLSLSIILANTIYTFSRSVDVDKALKKFSASDFLIGHADLFNNRYAGEDSALSESFVKAVKERPGFEKGGKLYGTGCTYSGKGSRQTMNRNADGSCASAIYGLDAFPFSRLNLVDGERDTEKLDTGGYILEGVQADDQGKALMNSFNHKVGDVIELKCGSTVKKMTILGHVIANPSTNTDGTWVGSAFFLPADEFRKLTGVQYAMSYAFDVSKDQEKAMETFLKHYTGYTEPEMNYTSKFTAISGLEGIKDTAMLIGGTLALIIGLIGILNFINVMMTSVLARRHEFAMLQSIGMTRKQLKTVLCLEGGSYAMLTSCVSVVLSIVSSLLIVSPLSRNIWFMSFHFVLWPLAVILPVLFLLAALVPMLIYHSTISKSIVEQLRELQ